MVLLGRLKDVDLVILNKQDRQRPYSVFSKLVVHDRNLRSSGYPRQRLTAVK